MFITVMNIVGGKTEIYCNDGNTIAFLKYFSMRNMGIGPDKMSSYCLVHESSILEDSRNIGHYKLTSGSKITLIFLMKSGFCSSL